MNNHTVTGEVSAGQDIVAEARRLLGELKFTPERGATLAGEHVRVSVYPERTEDRKLRAYITCYAYGHRLVDWSALRIGLQTTQHDAPFQLFPLLDARGQTSLPTLDPDSYSLRAYHRTKQIFRAPIIRVLASGAEETGKEQPRMTRARGAVRTRGGKPWTAYSPDDLTTVKLYPLKVGVRVDFETTNQDFAKATVEFCFTDPDTSDVIIREQAHLEQVSGEKRWKASRDVEVSPDQTFEFSHRIF